MGCECVEQISNPVPEGINGTLGGLAQQCLELGEELLDWVEVGRIGRQVEQHSTRGFDGVADACDLVSPEIVEDDDVARPQGGRQDLLDIGEERIAVHRAVDDAGCGERGGAKRRHEGRGLPVAIRAPSRPGVHRAAPGRAAAPCLLRRGVATLADRIWRENGSESGKAEPFEASAAALSFYDEIQKLSPRNEAQRSLQARAIDISTDLAKTRLLLFAKAGGSIPMPFLVVLVSWLTIIFASFSPLRR